MATIANCNYSQFGVGIISKSRAELLIGSILDPDSPYVAGIHCGDRADENNWLPS